MRNAEALADEIRSQSKRRDSEHFQQSHYAGVRSRNRRRKYTGCEYVRRYGSVVRKLTELEIDAFFVAVNRCLEARLCGG